MGYLTRKSLRDLRHNPGQYVAVALVVAIGVACYVGMMSVAGSVGRGVDDFYAAQKLADFWVKSAAIDQATVDQVRALPTVAAADARLALSASAGDASFTVHTIAADPTVNLPALDSGHLPTAATDCAVDRGYAAANHLSLGDTIAATIDATSYRLTLVGVFNSPEYLYLAKDITAQPDHLTYGALLVSPALLPDRENNELVVVARPGADLERLRAQLAQIAVPGGAGLILGRAQLLSWAMLDQDIQQYGQIGAVFPVLFFLVAAAIVFIAMSKTVESQRGQIGTMKALGLPPRLIGWHFLSSTLLTCLVGAGLGVVIGLVAVLPGIRKIFTSYYTMPPTPAAGVGSSIVVATLLALAFGGAATIWSVGRPLRESAAAAMRPKPPRSSRPILLERTGWWPRLSFGSKIVWRNLFLNQTRALLSSIGLIGCVGLLLASFAFLDSIGNVLGPRFDAMNQYDVAVTLASPLPAGSACPLIDAAIATATPQGALPASFEASGQIVSTNLTALASGTTAIALYDRHGARLALPDHGVIIPQLFAQTYHLSVGDAIALTVTAGGGQTMTADLTVAAVARQYLEQDIYASFDYLGGLGLTIPVQSYLLAVDPGRAAAVAASASQNPAVAQALTKADLAKAWSSEMSLLNSMVWIMIAASAILALTVVYNISVINIVERRRDIATLKVLGYHRREVNRLVFRENLIITAFGAIVGLPVGVGMTWLLIHAVVSTTMTVPLTVRPWSAVYAVALGFGFTIAANQLLRGKIRRIDMVESLKSVE